MNETTTAPVHHNVYLTTTDYRTYTTGCHQCADTFTGTQTEALAHKEAHLDETGAQVAAYWATH